MSNLRACAGRDSNLAPLGFPPFLAGSRRRVFRLPPPRDDHAFFRFKLNDSAAVYVGLSNKKMRGGVATSTPIGSCTNCGATPEFVAVEVIMRCVRSQLDACFLFGLAPLCTQDRGRSKFQNV